MKTLEEIDFTAIKHVNIFDVVPLKKYWRLYATCTVISLLSFVVGIAFGLTITAIVFSTIIGQKYRNEKSKIYKDFAVMNNWTFNKQKPEYALPIGLQQTGSNQVASDFIEGSYDDNAFQIFDYSYTIGSGKNRSTVKSTIVEVKIKNSFPYILLDSVTNGGGASKIPVNAVVYELEGNFNDYFKLYMDESYSIDVLSIITPDVMQTAMEANTDYDIEIFNDKVFFYTFGDKRSKEYIKDLFAGVDKLMDELNHKAKSYKPFNQTKFEVNKLMPASKTVRIMNKILYVYVAVFSVVAFLFIVFILFSLNYGLSNV